MLVKSNILESIMLMERIEIATKEIDLILIGVEPFEAALQAKRWMDIKRRKGNANKSGS